MDQRQYAIYYLNRRSYGRAEHHLRQWVLSHPDDIYAHMELIWCFCQRGIPPYKWNDCNEFYDKVYKRPNYQLLKPFLSAERMFYEDREEQAIDEYRLAIEAGLDVPAVHHSLAIALKELGRYEEAQEEFETVLSVDPLFLPTLHSYGVWLFAEGRFDRLEILIAKLADHEDEDLHLVFEDAKADIAHLQSLRSAAAKLRAVVHLRNEDKMREAALELWPVFREHKNNCVLIRTMTFLFYKTVVTQSVLKRYE